MSHIVTVETQVRDVSAIQVACRRLSLPASVHGNVSLFSGEVTGWAVKLNDWQYPLVCDTTAGKLHYDNFGGRWGNQTELDRFLQAYAVEKTKLEAKRKGHLVTESPLSDGSIKLTIQVRGGVA